MRILILMLALGLAISSPASSADPTREAFNLPDAAVKICDCIAQVEPSQPPIFVGTFRGFGIVDLGLAKQVGEELERRGYTVQPGSMVEVEARLFRLPRDPAIPITGLEFRGQLVYSTGITKNFTINISNRERAHEIASPSGETLPPPEPKTSTPTGEPPQNVQPIVRPTVRGNRLLPSPSSPYSVSVVKRQGDKLVPCEFEQKQGQTWISLPKDTEYAVQIHNDSEFDAGAKVLIDGLSRFALHPDKSLHGLVDIVPPRQVRTVSGYYRNNQQADRFVIGKAIAASKITEPANLRTITITFRAAWPEGQTPPAGEPGRTKSILPPGTQPGPPINDPIQIVKREFGATRAVLRIYYSVD